MLLFSYSIWVGKTMGLNCAIGVADTLATFGLAARGITMGLAANHRLS